MHNYLMFEHMFQVHLIPPERVHPKLWKGPSRWHKPVDWVQIERKRHDKERTLEEHKKLVGEILKRDQKKCKKIEAAGIDYECPEIWLVEYNAALASICFMILLGFVNDVLDVPWRVFC
ncbi:unnamed protein product [Camellia sinensis]